MRACAAEARTPPRAAVQGPTHFSLPGGEDRLFQPVETPQRARPVSVSASPHCVRPELNPLTANEFSRTISVSPFSRVANRGRRRHRWPPICNRSAAPLKLTRVSYQEHPLVVPLTITIREEFACWSSIGKSASGL